MSAGTVLCGIKEKNVFEKHQAKVAQEKYLAALSAWQLQEQWVRHCIDLCQTYTGGTIDGLVLGAGERGMYTITGASLVATQHAPGHYAGTSSGFSIPVGSLGGHSVRYRVGASRGHYVEGPLVEKAIDTGKLCITDKRIVFIGANNTKECVLDKLVSFNVAGGELTVAVSNRQKNLVVNVGTTHAADVDFYVKLALAHHQGTVADLTSQYQSLFAEVEKAKPVAPA